MTAAEKWNKIVEYHHKYIDASEQTVQNIWENIFAELLGYSRLENEVERHRNIQIGSTDRVITDIIIKNGGTDLFVAELKQHNLPFAKSMELQLLSYLKQLRSNTGVLICNMVYIFAHDVSKSDDEQEKIEIEFTQDNPDGIRFVELFSKATFDELAVKEFAHKKTESARKVEVIRSQLTSELIAGALINYFIDEYSVTEIERAIAGFNITITPKGALPRSSALRPPDSTPMSLTAATLACAATHNRTSSEVNTKTSDVVNYIKSKMQKSKAAGAISVVIRGGEVHRELGLVSRIPTVCGAMRKLLKDGDIIHYAPPSGNGSRLEIEYFL